MKNYRALTQKISQQQKSAISNYVVCIFRFIFIFTHISWGFAHNQQREKERVDIIVQISYSTLCNLTPRAKKKFFFCIFSLRLGDSNNFNACLKLQTFCAHIHTNAIRLKGDNLFTTMRFTVDLQRAKGKQSLQFIYFYTQQTPLSLVCEAFYKCTHFYELQSTAA